MFILPLLLYCSLRCADNTGAAVVPRVEEPLPPSTFPPRHNHEVTEAKSRRSSVGDANHGFEPEKVQGKYLPCLVHWQLLSPCTYHTRADAQCFVFLLTN